MVKTQEELKQLKAEYETLTNKLKELTDDELMQVTGGFSSIYKNTTYMLDGEQKTEPCINGYYMVCKGCNGCEKCISDYSIPGMRCSDGYGKIKSGQVVNHIFSIDEKSIKGYNIN